MRVSVWRGQGRCPCVCLFGAAKGSACRTSESGRAAILAALGRRAQGPPTQGSTIPRVNLPNSAIARVG